jgi:hypothetical protein
VRAVAFSPNSKLLASAADDGTMVLWARDGTELLLLHAVAGKDAALAMTPGPEPKVELLGPEAELAANDLACRVGPFSFSFGLCRERAEATKGLLPAAMAGARRGRDSEEVTRHAAGIVDAPSLSRARRGRRPSRHKASFL